MALYTDIGGKPVLYNFESAEENIGNGINLLPLATPESITAGTYWIVLEVNNASTVCVDSATSNTIVGGLEPFGTFPGNFNSVGSETTTTNTVDYNFFVYSND